MLNLAVQLVPQLREESNAKIAYSEKQGFQWYFKRKACTIFSHYTRHEELFRSIADLSQYNCYWRGFVSSPFYVTSAFDLCSKRRTGSQEMFPIYTKNMKIDHL